MVKKFASIKTQKRDICLNDLAKFYKGLVENKITIGVHKMEGRTVGTTDIDKSKRGNILERAFWNEFGTTHLVTKDFKKKARTDGKWVKFKKGTLIKVDPRPFVRMYLYPKKLFRITNEYRNIYNSSIRSGLKSPLRTAKILLQKVAFKGEKEMQDIIRSNNILEPNHEMTIYLKGFDYPLFETGGLLNAIKGKVSKR